MRGELPIHHHHRDSFWVKHNSTEQKEADKIHTRHKSPRKIARKIFRSRFALETFCCRFFSHSASHSPSPSHRLTPLRGRQTFGSLTLSFPLSIYAIPFSSLLCHNMYLFKHCLSPSFPLPMTLLMTIKFFSSFVLLFDGELLNKNQ